MAAGGWRKGGVKGEKVTELSVVECWDVMYWVSKYHKRGTIGQEAASGGMENKKI